MKKSLFAASLLVIVGGGGLMAHRLTTSAPATSGCGRERWGIKTLSDPDAGMVHLNTTVWASPHSLGSLPVPASLPQDARIAPLEDTVYRETVTLVKFKLEADSDIHLVIAGSAGRTMIAEIPNPSCVQSTSPVRGRIAAARSTFTNRFGEPSSTWQTANVPVKLTGVFFYDFKHGATGASPNGSELHPVLSVSFP